MFSLIFNSNNKIIKIRITIDLALFLTNILKITKIIVYRDDEYIIVISNGNVIEYKKLAKWTPLMEEPVYEPAIDE
jgi:hypothetical protein